MKKNKTVYTTCWDSKCGAIESQQKWTFTKQWISNFHMGGWLKPKKHPIDSSCYYAMVKRDQCRGLMMVFTKIFILHFEHIKADIKNLSFISLNVVLLLYVTFKCFIFIKMRFYIHSIYFIALNIIILYFSSPFLEQPGT